MWIENADLTSEQMQAIDGNQLENFFIIFPEGNRLECWRASAYTGDNPIITLYDIVQPLKGRFGDRVIVLSANDVYLYNCKC